MRNGRGSSIALVLAGVLFLLAMEPRIFGVFLAQLTGSQG